MTQQDTKNIIIECHSCYSGDAALEKQEEKEVHEASFDSFTRNRGKSKFSLVINNDNNLSVERKGNLGEVDTSTKGIGVRKTIEERSQEKRLSI